MKSRNSGLEISSIVMREWRTCLLWAVPFAALLTVTVLLLPKKYASEMKILVNNERQDPIISTDYTRYTPQPHEESEMQVNSEGQLLRSSDVDCSYRLVAAGYRLVYAPAAVIYHRNERTPWGLVHEGYVHAVHAPRVRALHAEFLARLRTERRSSGSRPAPVAAPAGHWSDPLWQSLFNFGKRLGRAHAAWRVRS